jgi:tetratricopeptide (TPR) repeat protein
VRIKLDLHNLAARSALLIAALFCAVVFIGLATARFVTVALTDPKVWADQEIIEAAINHLPNSARLHARLAARLIESNIDVDQTQSHECIAERAVYHASRAASLAPRDYESRALLAAAREMNGDLVGAEADMRAALALAPHHVDARWRLANLLLRAGKLDQAISEFRAVTEADPGRLTATLNLIWQASDGNIEALGAATGSDPRRRLTLARYLVEQERAGAAVEILSGLDRSSLLDLPESGQLLDALVSAGKVELAGKLWRSLVSDGSAPLLWNGSFETPVREGFTQFDWNLSQNKYARIGITTGNGRTGQRSLRIAYLSVDTTKLDGEIRQLILARPGARYRLTCYVKADNLVTPGGPQLVVTSYDSETPVAASDILAAGSYDWRPLTINFVAPSGARALVISVKQTPQFSYVEPTKGTVWFDDFILTEE